MNRSLERSEVAVKQLGGAIGPAGAISTNLTTGARHVDKEKCIGCSACVCVCPFGVAVLDRSLKKSVIVTYVMAIQSVSGFAPRMLSNTSGAMMSVPNSRELGWISYFRFLRYLQCLRNK